MTHVVSVPAALRRPVVTLTLIVLVAAGLAGQAPAARGQDRPAPMKMAGEPSPAKQQAVEDVAGADRAGVDGPLRRVGFSLAWLHRAYDRHQASGKSAQPFVSPVPGVRVQGEDGAWIGMDAVAREDAATLLADLRRVGLRNGAAAGKLVSGQLPISAIDEAARLSSLHSARPALAVRSVGAVTTQGVAAMQSGDYRQRLDADGSGAVVGLLSDSYDNAERAATDAEADVQSGDLPGPGNPNGRTTPVRVLDEADTPRSDEGRAMAQIVHDVAPGAELLFHTAFDGGSVNFAEGIRDLADEGATTIVDDVLFLGEPMFQDGIVAQAVDDVVFGEGATYVTSAGNNARRSYESPFRPSSAPGPVSGGPLHDFDPTSGLDVLQTIRVDQGVTVRIGLHWNQPAASVGGEGASTDLEIYVVNEEGETVGLPQRRSNVGGNPFEFTAFVNQASDGESGAQTYGIGIERVEGPPPTQMKYVLIADGTAERVEYAEPSPTLYGHPNARGAIAVAASAYFNTPAFNDNVERPILNSFSSKGGIPILFDDLGRPLPGEGEQRRKPDVTGPDGVNTTFFGSDLGAGIPGDDDTFPNFFGTSAAAPHVAGLVALMQDAEPGLAPRAYADALRRSAVDILRTTREEPTGTGFDAFSGAGFVRGDRLTVTPPPVRDLTAEVEPEQPGALRVSWREGEASGTEPPIREYVVEQSFLGGAFTPVDSVRSRGPGTYASVQDDLQSGVYDYRLRVRREGEAPEIGPRTRGVVPVQGQVAVEGPYPNPVDGGPFRLQLTVPEDQGVVLALYDALGRRVGIIYRDFLRANRPRIARIDASTVNRFASGLYFIRIVGEQFDTAVPVTFVR